jgi:hypothetical protein
MKLVQKLTVRLVAFPSLAAIGNPCLARVEDPDPDPDPDPAVASRLGPAAAATDTTRGFRRGQETRAGG